MADTIPTTPPAKKDVSGLDEIVRSFPSILDTLRQSYGELEERAARVENELCRANEELERKVHELDVVKRHLEAVLESLPCGVVVRDAFGTIAHVNESALEILGAHPDEIVGSTDHESLQGEDGDGEPREVRRRDGKRLVLASRFSHVRLASGDCDGSVEILDDRTERTALIERLHVADKMAALGTMAAGSAHEIRNPLSAVRGFADLLRKNRRSEEQSLRWASLIVEGVDEIDSIIQNMLTFGSPERLRLEHIDPEELLREAVRVAMSERNRTRSGDELAVNVHAEAPTFLGDRIKLRQAIRNLVTNAAEVQSDRGRIDVDLRHEDDEIVVRVADAGPGIPEDQRNRILDPFFTTRADGTGLGLALVSTIAQLHGGTVEVSPDPSPLGGAEIRLHIPHQPAQTSAASPSSPRGNY